MPFRPFRAQLCQQRIVVVPSGLDAQQRGRFVTKIAAAVRQQAGFAAKSEGVLRPGGEVIEDRDRLIIPHEPACPLDPAAVSGERPDIQTLWWLTWASLDALRPAAAENAPHGGIQLRSLFLDQCGRPKVSDFGIAPAFESIRGPEARRQIHCEARGGDGIGVSGVWSLLGEDEAREHGWLTPFLAHELLDGKQRPSAKADQFALGAVLFLLATGTHPYGAALSDPSLMFYFVLDPYRLADERPEWADAFEREKQQLVQPADRGVLAWSGLVRKLLASDPQERFANPAEAEKFLRDYVPPAWVEARTALAQAAKALGEGDAGAFLDKARPCRDNAALPPLWREQLSPWVDKVAADKEIIEERVRLRRKLTEAQRAFDEIRLDEARQLAAAVRDAPLADDPLREGAGELLANCDEQEQFPRPAWDETVAAYLDAVRESMAKLEFDEARDILNALIADPATPQRQTAQCRDLLTEIELIEQRIERQRAALQTARDEIRAGAYLPARQRLEELLAETDLPPDLPPQARPVLSDLIERIALQAEYLAAIDAGRGAWERGEAAAVEERLAAVPTDFDDERVAQARGELVHLLAALRQAQKTRAKAEGARARLRLDEALELARQAAGDGELPALLIDELNALVHRYERAVAHQADLTASGADLRASRFDAARQRLEALLAGGQPDDDIALQVRGLLADVNQAHALHRKHAELLEQARQAWERADAAQLSALLSQTPPERLNAELAALRSDLTARRDLLHRALEAAEAARRALDARTPTPAIEQAQAGLGVSPLPEPTRAQLAALLDEGQALRAAQRQATLDSAAAQLDAARAALAANQRVECQRVLAALLTRREELTPELSAAAEQVQRDWQRAERAAAGLGAARDALDGQQFDAARQHLAALAPKGLPAALANEIEALRTDVKARAEAFLKARRDELAALLAEADQKLAAGELDAADGLAQKAGASPHLNDELTRRIAALRAAVANQRPIATALVTAEQALRRGDEPAHSAAQAALGGLPSKLPPWAQPRAAELGQRSAALADKLRADALKLAQQALAAAEKALEGLAVADARREIQRAAPALALDSALKERADLLGKQASRLERLLPQVDALQRLADESKWEELAAGADRLGKETGLPRALFARLSDLASTAAAGIAHHRDQLTQQLDALEHEIALRGRRVSRLAARTDAVSRDPLATPALQQRAAALVARVEALPRPKPPPLGLIVGVSAAAIAAFSLGAWWLLREKPPPPDPNEAAAALIAAAQQRWQAEVDAARAAADANAPARVIEVVRVPPDEIEVYASTQGVASARERILSGPLQATCARPLDAAWLAAAYPKRAPPDPNAAVSAEAVARAETRLRQQLDAARKMAAENALPCGVSLRVHNGEIEVRAAREAELASAAPRITLKPDQLDGFDLPDELLRELYPPRPPEDPNDKRIAAAVEGGRKRLAAQLDRARAAGDPNAPEQALELVRDGERVNVFIWPRGGERPARPQHTIALDRLATAELPADLLARVYPPPRDPNEELLEKGIPAAQARLQAALDEAHGRAIPGKPRYAVAVERVEGGKAAIYVSPAGGPREKQPWLTVAARELGAAQLPAARLTQILPPRTAEALIADLTTKLAAVLKTEPKNVSFKPQSGGQYSVTFAAAPDNAARRDDIRLNVAEWSCDPPIEQIATDLRASSTRDAAFRTALDAALSKPAEIAVSLGPDVPEAYRSAVRFVAAGAAPKATTTDAAAGIATVSGRARLLADKRTDAAFALTGRWEAHSSTLTADDAGVAEFRKYLAALQKARRAELPEAVRRALEAPAAVPVRLGAADRADAAEVEIGLGRQTTLATLKATWSAESLSYAVDARDAAASVSSAMEKAARAQLEAVRTGWPALRDRLTPALTIGGKFVQTEVTATGATVRSTDGGGLWSVPIEIALSAPDGVSLTPLRLDLVPGTDGLEVSAASLASASRTLGAELKTLGGDAGFRARRAKAALAAAAAGGSNVPPLTLESTDSSDELRATGRNGDETVEVKWTWDAASLSYTNPSIKRSTPPPPPPPDNNSRPPPDPNTSPPDANSRPPPPPPPPPGFRLASAANAPVQVPANDLVELLRRVAEKKIGRYGAGAGLSVRQLGGSGDEWLLALSNSLIAATAPNPATDPFPTIFVEYVDGNDFDADGVFGLAWRISAAEGRATNIVDRVAWRAMDRGQLGMKYEELRKQYGQVGGALATTFLAPALPNPLDAAPGNGSLGLMIAPDGPLWATRWEQVRFSERAVNNLAARGVPPSVSRFWELLHNRPYGNRLGLRQNLGSYSRTGIWCAPALAAVCNPPTQVRISLPAIPGLAKPPTTTPLRQSPLILGIDFPEAIGRVAGFQNVMRTVPTGNLGAAFWELGWTDPNTFEPGPVRSFILLPP